jgi:hypothetical protein
VDDVRVTPLGDFDALLGSHDLALHIVPGGERPHDDHRPRARVDRYERRDP